MINRFRYSSGSTKLSRLVSVIMAGVIILLFTQCITATSAAAAKKPTWSIRVELKANRWSYGNLYLYDKNGRVLLSAKCLGRSEYNTPMKVRNGNTPTGVYSGHLGGPKGNPYSYGPHKTVDLVGISGLAKTSGRTGILIHGGALGSKNSLRPTHGCVRVSNQDEKRLTDKIAALIKSGYDPAGRVTITTS